MLWLTSRSITGQTHAKLTSICFFTTTNCQIVRSPSLPHHMNYKSMCLSAYWHWKLANECASVSTVIVKNGFVVIVQSWRYNWKKGNARDVCSLKVHPTQLVICYHSLEMAILMYLETVTPSFCTLKGYLVGSAIISSANVQRLSWHKVFSLVIENTSEYNVKQW